MKNYVIMTALVSACFCITASPAWSFDFKPGTYKITSKTEMTGVPMQMPPVTFEQCMTKNEPIPEQSGSGTCRITNRKIKGNTISWSMECKQQGQTTTGTGKMIYKGNGFEGTFSMSLGAQAGNMTVKTQTTGERIGPCK